MTEPEELANLIQRGLEIAAERAEVADLLKTIDKESLALRTLVATGNPTADEIQRKDDILARSAEVNDHARELTRLAKLNAKARREAEEVLKRAEVRIAQEKLAIAQEQASVQLLDIQTRTVELVARWGALHAIASGVPLTLADPSHLIKQAIHRHGSHGLQYQEALQLNYDQGNEPTPPEKH